LLGERPLKATLEVLQSGVGSSREKRYLIPPDKNKKTKYQPEVYEDVTNPVDITSTCRPSAVRHVHQAFNGRDSHKYSLFLSNPTSKWSP
jgi:hypothetical protein